MGFGWYRIEYLKYTTPGFLYSVGMTPANAAAALAVLEIMQREPERLEKLRENAHFFVESAKARGLNAGLNHDTPIVPIILCPLLRETLCVPSNWLTGSSKRG
uniref:Aminotransferase class I and II n=1 Tax=Candidatus Kentrum sp. LPFa TaxID=2126335 RepID=A0A450W1L2_9GAMM|nr:MAG: hypothetical protein BECKLPF1236A_GA0070988_100462 [Candidatus Kentron sp. LPFa]VFK28328.1 MAG: hypothetical protein BECKLPF1236C_GA0070990_100632 [Candidatus Kentron sp. LPFa]